MTYFSDTDHTRRSAWRRSPTFVKAPAPKEHPRAGHAPFSGRRLHLTRRRVRHFPATRLLLQLRLTPTSLPTSLVFPSEPCTYLFWGFLSPSALQTVFLAKLRLLFLHPNPCTGLGQCSSTFLVVPRCDLRPSPFFGGATPQSEAVLGLSSIQIREYDHQKSDLYLCYLWISYDYLREIGWQ